MCKIAVIGGSGLYAMPGLEGVEEREIKTPFGDPSAPIIIGNLEGKQVAFLARHGIGHHISPSEINYRANVYALKSLGVERIVGISACGSLREDFAPGDIVVPDHGSLLRAVRASMAAPGVFPPVEMDGRTLIDGYLRVMLPTRVVQDMGADVVIAVHPGWAPGQTPPDTSWDLATILLQANYLLTWANTYPDLSAADIPITVPLPESSAWL